MAGVSFPLNVGRISVLPEDESDESGNGREKIGEVMAEKIATGRSKKESSSIAGVVGYETHYDS